MATFVDDFVKHHAIVKELFERLPDLRDDPHGYALAWAELRKHLDKLEALAPPEATP